MIAELSPHARSRSEEAVQPLIDELSERLTADEQQLVNDHLHGVAGVLRRHGRT